ncbi:MAG TPA: hypothetical protein VGJ15_03655, partial [Pirellulales bacterium]
PLDTQATKLRTLNSAGVKGPPMASVVANQPQAAPARKVSAAPGALDGKQLPDWLVSGLMQSPQGAQTPSVPQIAPPAMPHPTYSSAPQTVSPSAQTAAAPSVNTVK